MSFAVIWQKCVTNDPRVSFMSICLDDTPVDCPEFQERIDLLRRMRLIFHVSLQMRRRLEAIGLHPEISDSPYHFDYSFLIQAIHSIGKENLLLNSGAFFLPAGCLPLHPIVPEHFFIRPNSGMKSFPGQVIHRNDFLVFKNTYHLDDSEMCAIAPITHLTNETRCFVMLGSKAPLIAHSAYQHEDIPGLAGDPITTSEAENIVEVLSGFCCWPEGMVVDICRCEGRVRIVEINSISTSGLYQCEGVTSGIAERST